MEKLITKPIIKLLAGYLENYQAKALACA